MAKGKRSERPVRYRAVKFELKLSPKQEQLVLRLSDGLREVYNQALTQRVDVYEAYKAQRKAGVEKPDIRLPTLFDQINELTALREQDEQPGIPLGEIVAYMGFMPYADVDRLLTEWSAVPIVEVK